jgi:hypothetical protein
MSRKAKDNKTDDNLVYYAKLNDEGIKKSIVINANQMIDLNGKIDTFSLIDKALIDNNPIIRHEDKKGNILNADKDNNYWLKEIDNYIKYLTDTLDADISNTSADDLKQLTRDFNSSLITKYIGGIKTNIIDLIDSKENYANHLATALVDLQTLEILKIGISAFSKLDLSKTDASFKQYMQVDTLKRVQDALKEVKSKSNIDTNIIKPILYQMQILDSLKQVDNIISNNKKYYEDLHKKYETINKLLASVSTKYKARDDELSKYANAVAPKQAQNKQINLHLAKMFNNTYPLNKYTSIDKNHNEKYDIKLKISIDTEFKDLRDIVFVGDINKKQISLLPIDLALFIGFTSINNINGGNIPITLTDAFKFISEDKKIRIRKGQKAYQLYDEKMQLFKSFKVKSIIKDRDTNKTLIEFKDAIPILENYKVHIASRNDMGYIIGASAILSILNFLSEQEGIDYLTTFSTANSFINDNQSNTIAILNMKYYLIIKILQMGNASKSGKIYNPHINLDDLYKQTALLNGKTELNKTEKQRLRGQIETYLNHLKSKELLRAYDYTPFKEIATKDSNKLSNVSKSDLYIKL